MTTAKKHARGLLAAMVGLLAFGLLGFSSSNHAEDRTIRPFKAHIPQATINDLRRRVAATRFPDKGGHFTANELPQLFAEEMRAGFRSLRQQ